MSYYVALFGEAEKGDYQTAYFCHSLHQLAENLGNPPMESKGLFYAIQILLYESPIIFFRVREEGYSIQDYMKGLDFLENSQFVSTLAAVALPGVGDAAIIDATGPVCHVHRSLLITTEADLYDYITTKSPL